MEVASARARLVDFADGASPALATISRSEVEEAMQYEDGPPDLILDVTRFADGSEQPGQVAIAWERGDLEEILRRTEGDSVTLAFDPDALLTALDPEVEGHGLREGVAMLAVAVAAGGGVWSGSAAAQPDQGMGGTAAIEQVRSDAGASPAAAIEELRSESAATIAASGPGPVGAGIEAVRSAEAATPTSLAASADIEAVRSVQAAELASATGGTSVGSEIEAARSAATASGLTAAEAVETARSTEIAAGVGGTQAATEIESVRSAAAEAAREAADTSGGISVSLPSPATTGMIAGAVALLITGAAFASRRRITPAT